MAQPYKGPREQVATRIERAQFDKLDHYVTATGTTKSDFLRDLLLARLNEIDLDALEGQETLPMTA